ncbi:MAG: PD-(D/E)XK nuclease family protein [Planctomycetota bacterium]
MVRAARGAGCAVKVFHCKDAFELESCFRARVRAAAQSRAHWYDPITIIAPTARLLARLKVVAAQELQFAAGIEFLVHQTFAERVLRATGQSVHIAGELVIESLVREAARGDGRFERAILQFEGAAGSLASSIRDLRDAGVLYKPLVLPEPARFVWEAYGRFITLLRERKIADRAEMYQLAAKQLHSNAKIFDETFGTILHAGAYDLVGVVDELIQSAARAGRVEILALGVAVGVDDAPTLEWGSSRLAWAAAQPAEAAPAAPRRSGNVDITYVQAPNAAIEIDAAARRVFLWHCEGMPLEDIVIFSRSLESYAPYLAAAFQKYQIPFTTTAALPLERLPRVRALIDLLHCAVHDFPRDAWIRLLRSPLLNLQKLCKNPEYLDPDRAEWLGRKYLLSGAADWERRLPESLELEAHPYSFDEDRESKGSGEYQQSKDTARAAAETIRSILAASRAFADSLHWTGAARSAAEFARAICNINSDSAEAAALDCVLKLELLDAAKIEYIDSRDFVRLAVHAIRAARDPVQREDRGGVRVFDMQQLRGLSFRRGILLGFHEGNIPRVVHEDALLPDSARKIIKMNSGKAVPIKSEGPSEEKWLFSLALGAVSESLVVSRQNSDEKDRPRNASIFARELRQIESGSSRMNIYKIPANPGRRFIDITEREQILHPRDAVVCAALSGGGREAALAAVRDLQYLTKQSAEQFEFGIMHLEACDAFQAARPEQLQFDGLAGAVPLESIGVTTLERLGRCPLQYFFSDYLQIVPHEDPDLTEPIDRREIGIVVHNVLAELYNPKFIDILRRNSADSISAARAEADQNIPRLLDGHFAILESGRLRGHAAIARAMKRRIGAALSEFVRSDISNLANAKIQEMRCEEPFQFAFDANGEKITVNGRFDRIVVDGAGEAAVTDYKTSRKIDDFASAAKVARAEQLQLPLYYLASGARAEAVSIGMPLDGARVSKPAVWEADKATKTNAEMLQSIGSILKTVRSGAFPITLDREHCKNCDYKSACRRAHSPTRARVRSAPEFSLYYSIGSKPAGGESDKTEAKKKSRRSNPGE